MTQRISIKDKKANILRKYTRFCFILTFTLFITVSAYSANDKVNIDTDNKEVTQQNTTGVTDTEIIIGSILPLEGYMAEIGWKIRAGLDKSLANQMVGKRQVSIIYANDLYEPLLTPLRVQRLLQTGIFAMIGNVGTPTAVVALPILRQANIPAIGFFTGSGLLRTGDGLILNYRASYTQEIVAVVDAAINAGVKPEHVCAYVQNDEFGKAGVTGLQEALIKAKAPTHIIHSLTTILSGNNDWLIEPYNDKAPINQNGPVGVYMRNQVDTMPGYQSLKEWEQKTGYSCNLVIAVGTYDNLANFIHTARSFGESWIISTISFSGADNFRRALLALENLNPTTNTGNLRNVLTTQVTPPLDSKLPIVQEAQQLLGKKFDFISLEGYIIGKMMLELLRKTPDPLTPMSFANQAKQVKLDLGNLLIDFTRNGYQASDLVTITKLIDTGYVPINAQDWDEMLTWKRVKTETNIVKPKPHTESSTEQKSVKSSNTKTSTDVPKLKRSSEKKPKVENKQDNKSKLEHNGASITTNQSTKKKRTQKP